MNHSTTAPPFAMVFFGSRGGFCMMPSGAGSSRITMTGKIAMKKLRNSTMIGVRGTPSLMSNRLATRNSSTSENSCDIWNRT